MIVPAADAEQPAERTRAGCDAPRAAAAVPASRGILGRWPLPHPKRCGGARAADRDPAAGGRLLRHRRHAGADRRARRGRPGARGDRRCCWAGWRAATACVACVSGRSAAEARRLVGVGGITYAGSTAPSCSSRAPPAALQPGLQELGGPREDVRRRPRQRPTCGGCACGSRTRARSSALHWRGAPDEDAARARAGGARAEAEAAGLATHWGRKVLEMRPAGAVRQGPGRARPASSRPVVRGRAVRRRRRDRPGRLRRAGRARRGGRARDRCPGGRGSDEGPAAIVERADLVVDGLEGFAGVLAVLAEA